MPHFKRHNDTGRIPDFILHRRFKNYVTEGTEIDIHNHAYGDKYYVGAAKTGNIKGLYKICLINKHLKLDRVDVFIATNDFDIFWKYLTKLCLIDS